MVEDFQKLPTGFESWKEMTWKRVESALKNDVASICPDISTDSKWSTVDLRSLFDSGGLSSLWNDLVRSGELVSNDADLTGTGQLFSYSYFPNTQFGSLNWQKAEINPENI